MKKAEFIHIL